MKQLRLITIVLLLPIISHAWNGIGHSTCGAMAYYYLKSSKQEATIAKVLDILKSHPWYNMKIWTSKYGKLQGEQKEVMLFMLASTFPDDARDSADYGGDERRPWHYVDYPFAIDGIAPKGKQPPSPNAEEKLTEFYASLNKQTNKADKAVTLCWIFHLIEDIHQPLHSACLFDKLNKKGDRGGNDTYFILPGSSFGTKMHGYWDGIIKGNFNEIPAHAKAMLGKNEYKESNLPELKNKTLHDWIVKESFELAKTKAYLNGTINGNEAHPTELPAGSTYAADATKTGERRAVLASIRLANKLTELLK